MATPKKKTFHKSLKYTKSPGFGLGVIEQAYKDFYDFMYGILASENISKVEIAIKLS